MNQNKVHLATWIRIDGNGNTIPGSSVERPIGTRPRSGRWMQIPTSVCCFESTIMTFRNTTGSANITAISTGDGAIDWTGTLENAGIISFVVPSGYNETWSVTVSSFSGRTLTNSVAIQNTGSTGAISAVGSLAALTTTFTTSGVGAQFLSILS